MQPILLIDGRNIAYRSLFAAHNDLKFTASKYHPFIVWIKFIKIWLDRFKPRSIQVFWDISGPLWRNKIHPEYKGHRDALLQRHNFDVKAALADIESAAKAIIPFINLRQHHRQGEEADDLIYSACKLLTPQSIIIISSDSDFTQIPWFMPHVRCFNPNKNIFVKSDVNPIIIKALAGDKADNIDGYCGIGKVKSHDMALDPELLSKFLSENDNFIFRRNIALIDLSLCPHRIHNDLCVLKNLSEEIIFDKSAIFEVSKELKVRGIMSEYGDVISPFKRLSK